MAVKITLYIIVVTFLCHANCENLDRGEISNEAEEKCFCKVIAKLQFLSDEADIQNFLSSAIDVYGYNCSAYENDVDNDESLAEQVAKMEVKLAWLARKVTSGLECDCPAGPPGPKGLKGDRGYPGERGATGRRGTRGMRGIKGTAGECIHRDDQTGGHLRIKGEKGEPGLYGSQGLPGYPGQKGEKGEPMC